MRVGMSTSSVYPESTAAAFEIAAQVGSDGVEIMVGADAISQDETALLHLRDHYGVPILALHSPCLLITQRVWGTDSWEKLVRAQKAAELLGAQTVVVHPPFRWQRDYAREFVSGIARMDSETDVRFVVENMYPWRAGPGAIDGYSPGWDVRAEDYPHIAVDTSHCAVAIADPVEYLRDVSDRVRHVHFSDGTHSSRDEHLLPGEGILPLPDFVREAAAISTERDQSFDIILEVSTRAARDRDERVAMIQAAHDYVRRELP